MHIAKEKNSPARIRGYTKLSDATRVFNFDFRDKTVLDIGSSTGGFTKLALDRGAARVIAVEKGSHQMAAPLRFDPRVELHEKTDIFNVIATGSADQATVPPQGTSISRPVDVAIPDVIVADVSFLSLTKVLEYAKLKIARPSTDFLVMLKPQFEASSSQLRRGVVKNNTIRRQIIKDFEIWLKHNGFFIVQKHDNSLPGKNGNLERFYWLRLSR